MQVEAGEIFWVVGPNGAGKTSLLRVMAGLDAPRRGTVTRDGPGLLYFQSEMALPPSATVRSWERLVQRLGRSRRRGLRTPLWPDVQGKRRIGRLSTGERKRLLLDALLRQRGPLALDEPFEHLSPGARFDLAAILEERARWHEVIVATNQRTPRMAGARGLRLEGGAATRLHPAEARPWGRP